MDIIQVTNPKFRPQTMRSIIVANARHEMQLASQMKTLGYHRHNFLAKNERERKCLTAQLTEMTTIMEASRARDEEQRQAMDRHGGEQGSRRGTTQGQGATTSKSFRAQRAERRPLRGR